MKNRLKEIREERGLTLEGLREMLDREWAVSTINNFENEKQDPSPRLIRKLSQVLKVPMRELVPGWEEEEREYRLQERVDVMREDGSDPNLVTFMWKGDSMHPNYQTGDQLVASRNERVEDGDLVVAETREGDFYFKVFHRAGPNRGKLTSYNAVYPPIEVELEKLRYIYPVVAVHRVTKEARRRDRGERR